MIQQHQFIVQGVDPSVAPQLPLLADMGFHFIPTIALMIENLESGIGDIRIGSIEETPSDGEKPFGIH